MLHGSVVLTRFKFGVEHMFTFICSLYVWFKCLVRIHYCWSVCFAFKCSCFPLDKLSSKRFRFKIVAAVSCFQRLNYFHIIQLCSLKREGEIIYICLSICLFLSLSLYIYSRGELKRDEVLCVCFAKAPVHRETLAILADTRGLLSPRRETGCDATAYTKWMSANKGKSTKYQRSANMGYGHDYDYTIYFGGTINQKDMRSGANYGINSVTSNYQNRAALTEESMAAMTENTSAMTENSRSHILHTR